MSRSIWELPIERRQLGRALVEFDEAALLLALIENGTLPPDIGFRLEWLDEDDQLEALTTDVLAALGMGPPSKWADQYIGPAAQAPDCLELYRHAPLRVAEDDWHRFWLFRQFVSGYEKEPHYYSEERKDFKKRAGPAFRYWGAIAMAISPGVMLPIDEERMNRQKGERDYYYHRLSHVVIKDQPFAELYEKQATLKPGDPEKIAGLGRACFTAMRLMLHEFHPEVLEFQQEHELWLAKQQARKDAAIEAGKIVEEDEDDFDL